MRDNGRCDIPHAAKLRVERYCSQISVEPYSPEGPENVKQENYIDVRGDFLGPPHGHNDSCCGL